MTIIQRIFWGHLLLGTAALAAGYAIIGHHLIALMFVLAGALWFAAQQRAAYGLGEIMLFLFGAGGALGFLFGVPGWLILVAVVAVLGAWDLAHFLQRLGAVEQVAYDTGLGQAHLRRLAIVEGAALALGLLALVLQARVSAWWEILLALLAVIGISRLVAYIRQQTEGFEDQER